MTHWAKSSTLAMYGNWGWQSFDKPSGFPSWKNKAELVLDYVWSSGPHHLEPESLIETIAFGWLRFNISTHINMGIWKYFCTLRFIVRSLPLGCWGDVSGVWFLRLRGWCLWETWLWLSRTWWYWRFSWVPVSSASGTMSSDLQQQFQSPESGLAP